ncbi:hypothetical protein TNCV_4839081 [Trichonephila clavipes]|nr:hypothetical protein TNCV_4839081 [Trichonephila clavipes]
MSYASRACGYSLRKKINSRLIRRTQRKFLLLVIKGYKTTNYEAVFDIYGIPPIDLVILNSINVQQNNLSTSLEKLIVEVQSILYYLEDCDITFLIRGHSGNLGNDRVDQLAKEATCQDMNLSMSVSFSY